MAALGAIVLGKIVAVYFNPAEFGKYFIFSNLVTIYTSVVSMPSIQSFRHEYYRRDADQPLLFYRSLFFWFFSVLVLGLLIGGWLNLIPMIIVALVIGQIFSQSNSALHMANINIQGFNILQSVLQVLLPFLSIALVLITVHIFHQHQFLSLWGSNVTAEFCLLLASYFVFRPNHFTNILSFKKLIFSHQFFQYWKYIKPIVWLPLFIWIVHNMDRYILDIYYSKHEVGIYAAAYGIGSKIFLLLSGGIITYLNAAVYQEAHSTDHIHHLFSKTIRRVGYYFLIGLCLVAIVWVLREFIGQTLLSDQYAQSFQLMPLLALANLIFSCIFFFEQAIYAIGKTKYILFHYATGAAINMALNFLLIPPCGAWGAGISMIVSSSLQLMFLIWLFRRAFTVAK